jgi:hypothetical protein
MAKTPSNEFGFKFGEPPAPPRKNERNDELWKAAQDFLQENPGKWAKIKTWDNPTTASTYASNINNNKNKSFPSAYFEARYEATRNQDGTGTSSLWLCCTVVPKG